MFARLVLAMLVLSGCDARGCHSRGSDSRGSDSRGSDSFARSSARDDVSEESMRGAPASVRSGPPDVLVVTIDTARADRFGAYGYATARTPVFDALAARGVRYLHATTPTPLTVPAHVTLFTGLHPAVHGSEVNAPPPTPLAGHTRPQLLAEEFRAFGYRTAAFVASGILAPRFGLSDGFATYDAPPIGVRELPATDRVERALAWVDTPSGLPLDAPFFLWLHFMEAHSPHIDPATAAIGPGAYDGELAAVDDALGVLLAGLRARGRAERLVVIVVGDHGEGFGDHGEVEHGVLLYEETMRVPLVISAPRDFIGGRVVDRAVTLADLAPTLRESCGLAAVESDGVSLRGEPGARDVVDQSRYSELMLGWAPLRALRRGTLVYIDAPRPELYDLAADPGERDNLLSVRPDDARSMASALIAARAALLARRRTTEQPGAIDEARARLTALGYATQTSAASSALADPKDMIADYEARRTARGVGRPPTWSAPTSSGP